MNVLDFPEGQHLKAVDASPWSGSILRAESLQEASCPEEQRLTCSRSWGRHTNHYKHSNSLSFLMDPRTTVKIVMSGQCHPTTAPAQRCYA
jgi:hypothetical protein